ncbi:hypothetical protein ONZ45_g3362 [Pleurotus djamor]|nr:hypothetical protein ONZ45_g3362 [Pleurotus djamor]
MPAASKLKTATSPASKSQPATPPASKEADIPIVPMVWDPIYALADYDARTSTEKGHIRPPIAGVSLSRLLQIHWITMDDIKEDCNEDDFAALTAFRTFCLKVALDTAGLWPMSKKLIIHPRFLGLGDKRLNIGSGSNVVRWEDGERPWMLRWNSGAEVIPSECMNHVFNAAYPKHSESASEDDMRISEMLMNYIPSAYSRQLHVTSFLQHVAQIDAFFLEQAMLEESGSDE